MLREENDTKTYLTKYTRHRIMIRESLVQIPSLISEDTILHSGSFHFNVDMCK